MVPEGLYLWAEDLPESHVPQVERVVVCDGCTDGRRPRQRGGGAGQCVGDDVGLTWYMEQVGGVLGDEGKLPLLAT